MQNYINYMHFGKHRSLTKWEDNNQMTPLSILIIASLQFLGCILLVLLLLSLPWFAVYLFLLTFSETWCTDRPPDRTCRSSFHTRWLWDASWTWATRCARRKSLDLRCAGPHPCPSTCDAADGPSPKPRDNSGRPGCACTAGRCAPTCLPWRTDVPTIDERPLSLPGLRHTPTRKLRRGGRDNFTNLRKR